MSVVSDVRGAVDLGESTGSRVAVEGRKAKPVKWWAAIGACFVVVQVYVFTAWILSDDFVRTPAGPDDAPGWMMFLVRAQEIACPIGAVLMLYFFFYKPWRRDGRVGLDGLLCFVMLGTYWMDPMVNFTQSFATYNANFINRGSWVEFIPGWMSPGGSTFAEPLLWAGPTYIWALLGGMILANKFMARYKAKHPETGTAGMIAVCFAFFFVVDLVLEMVFMRMGVYTYAGSPEHLTFFSGHYYQFPIYEALFWGATWTGFACVRYFKNDKGETAAERGIEEVRATQGQKTAIRGLALLGMISMVFMSYNVVWNYISLNQGEWPADIQERSYFTDQLCGEGTGIACPGPDIPIPRESSGYVTPDGELAPPRG